MSLPQRVSISSRNPSSRQDCTQQLGPIPKSGSRGGKSIFIACILAIFYQLIINMTNDRNYSIFNLLQIRDMTEFEELKKKKDEKRAHNKMKKKPHPKKERPYLRKVGDYEIDFDILLGKGQFGNVYQAWKIDAPLQLYACKHISEKKLSSQDAYEQNLIGKTFKDRLLDEIKIHQTLNDCDHIVKLIHFQLDKDGYFLFMEMCKTDLGKQIKLQGTIDEATAMDFFKQLLVGYRYLYDKKISHRDLKPENLLLQNDELKIADFGFVKISEDIDQINKSQQKSQFLADSVVGTINYIAPEVLLAETNGTKYHPFKSDVWSMGIILYKMVYGIQPYRASSKSELLEQIDKKPLDFPQQKNICPRVINLLKSTIEKDPEVRIQFMALYQSCNEKTSSKSAISLKQAELVFYNELMLKISYDSANHATFREIGIEDYQKFSNKLLTLIHEKRQLVLEKNVNEDVAESIKNQIALYSNTFYYAIKESSEIQKGLNPLPKLLKIFHDKFAAYQQFSYLHKTVQYFLLLLLQLHRLEQKSVTIGFIKTMMQNEKNDKMKLGNLQKIRKTSLNLE